MKGTKWCKYIIVCVGKGGHCKEVAYHEIGWTNNRGDDCMPTDTPQTSSETPKGQCAAVGQWIDVLRFFKRSKQALCPIAVPTSYVLQALSTIFQQQKQHIYYIYMP